MRGINFGGALDGGDDGRLGARHLDVVREAGFDTVRLPVKWSAHLAPEPPYTVDPAFFERVDRAVEDALRRDLRVVLDVHHFDDVVAAPRLPGAVVADREALRAPRRPALLRAAQRAARAADRRRWNRLLAEALAVVRASNPERAVIVGPVRGTSSMRCPQLRLPDDDRLIVTVHYYSPFRFTHQGAHWLEHDGAADWLGTAWGTDEERARVTADLEGAAAWARERGRPLFLGEFGAIEHADLAARARLDGARAFRGRAARHRLGVLGPRDRLRRVRPRPGRLARAAAAVPGRRMSGTGARRSDVENRPAAPTLSHKPQQEATR